MIERRSLRGAINAMCRACIVDERAPGSPAVQIAICTAKDCPLHPVRPITCSVIPLRVLKEMRIDPATLGRGVRELVSCELETGETDLCRDVGGGLSVLAQTRPDIASEEVET